MKNLLTLGLFRRAAAEFAAAAARPSSALIHSPLNSILAPHVVQKKPVRGQRNMTLRVHPKTGVIELRAPRRTSQAQLSKFLADHHDWMAERMAELAPHVPLVAGVAIPYLGQPRIIRADPSHKRGVRDNGHELLVGVGDAIGVNGLDTDMASALLAKRLRVFLVARAKREVAMRAKFYAGLMGKRLGTVAVRDMHSRWGSCSMAATGKERGQGAAKLSFNWRLILMPLFVLDYVVAHECAHMAHMDHSPAFWAKVNELIGDYSTAEDWLTQHGPDILRIG